MPSKWLVSFFSYYFNDLMQTTLQRPTKLTKLTRRFQSSTKEQVTGSCFEQLAAICVRIVFYQGRFKVQSEVVLHSFEGRVCI